MQRAPVRKFSVCGAVALSLIQLNGIEWPYLWWSAIKKYSITPDPISLKV